jgi:hypothetical protein
MDSFTPALYQLLNAPLTSICGKDYNNLDETVQLPVLWKNHDTSSETGLQD